MKAPLTISVLIPTYGRGKEVVDTIEALLLQTRIPDEVVLVDQNVPSIPAIDAVMKKDPRLKHVRSPTPGCVPNYNRALQAATGDIVLFMDDDVELSPDVVERHLARYASAEPVPGELAGIAGRVEQPSGDLNPSVIRVIGRYGRFTGRVIGNFNALQPASVDFATGGNMSFQRAVLLSAGGFDEGFDGNGYRFEQDIGLRLRSEGYRLEFEPRASLKHLMAPAGGARVRDKAIHTFQYAKNGLRLVRKHSPFFTAIGFSLFLILYSAAKSAYNGNIRILKEGLRGVWRGWAQNLT